MAGIEKTEAYKCLKCNETHEDIDDAITCCGLEITVKGKITITFEARVNPQNIRDYNAIVEETVDWTDYVDADLIYYNSDGEIEDIEYNDIEIDAPDVEE